MSTPTRRPGPAGQASSHEPRGPRGPRAGASPVRPWPEPPRAAVAAAVATATLALLLVALLDHPVGDYFTESDFYGGYAIGARLLRQGVVDPARYVVVGPVYEMLLALLGVFGDLFTAARVLAVASAGVTLALWASLARRWLGSGAAIALVALLAPNPHFARYATSVTTDLPAIAFQAGAFWLVSSASGPLGLCGAGLCAAAATLTRYSAAALVPALVLALAWLAPRPRLSRAMAVAWFAVGFVVPVAAWTSFSLGQGVLPGASLVSHSGFYADTSASSRNVQDRTRAGSAGASGVADEPATGGALSPTRLAASVLDHVRRDAGETLGWPVALLALAGLALLAFERRLRMCAPALAFVVCQAAVLVPVFHTPRYSLAFVPPLLLVASAVAAAPWWGDGRGRAWRAALALTAVLASASSGRDAVRMQRFLRTQLPVETLAAGRTLRAVAAPGARVMARKAHVAFEAGAEAIAFPRVDSLAALAQEARRARADYLYYSWYELELRPEFSFLLDTSGVVPGLEVVYATSQHPAVLYRIGPGFGRNPDWMSDRRQVAWHTARAQAAALPDELAWQAHLVLAARDAEQGRLESAATHLETVLRVRPDLGSARDALRRVRQAIASRGQPPR